MTARTSARSIDRYLRERKMSGIRFIDEHPAELPRLIDEYPDCQVPAIRLLPIG
jgi:hypothetical protein